MELDEANELVEKAIEKANIFFDSMSFEVKWDLSAAGLDTFRKTDDFYALVVGCFIQGYLEAKYERK